MGDIYSESTHPCQQLLLIEAAYEKIIRAILEFNFNTALPLLLVSSNQSYKKEYYGHGNG